jgi:predicted Fe-Mo cluster-binding NifX family protein
MKIAVVTDDGLTISRHFGRARMYAVLTVEDGAVVSRELRDKPTPHWRGGGHREDPEEEGPHGTGPAAQGKHDEMFAVVRDCDVMIAGGMGQGAYDHALAAGLRPIVTSLVTADEAAIECAAGRLEDETDRLH